MSNSKHARRPSDRKRRHKRRHEARMAPRPVLDTRASIAEQLAGWFDGLAKDVGTLPASAWGWQPELVYVTETPECPELEEYDDYPQHDMHNDAHLAECVDCAQDHANLYVLPALLAQQRAQEQRDAEDEFGWWQAFEPDEPRLPLMTYREAVAELGEFIVTGPNVVRPATTNQHHYVRVYELARACDLDTKAVIGLLRLRGEYVAHHLSHVARPAARDLLTDLDIPNPDARIEQSRPITIHDQFRALARY